MVPGGYGLRAASLAFIRFCPDSGQAKKFTLPAENPVLPLPSPYLPEMHVGPNYPGSSKPMELADRGSS